ncbi:nucleotidyl transferase AbiEii/AbiGii toxin family protein [Streptomyces coelicoflavus]|uniref:nucleotidyl transferase AbiEii/AbiGii toxin family protein n=1 Tax=Streptomyces coelicoflavus TaxID=285562 RepID=UPI0024ACEFA7|nr:nucleotidyl transferase AbiEii/AbiGii toxin family protein [Streptomyces coelicoflavus]MDI6517689.1 nucleotidyl transferase AbiEii/AbiGii toxin family protein [Streptomyces coelicoflavus]
MRLPHLHARLLADVLAIGSPYPLVITGGYAVQAHELLARPSQDLDVATENPAPMEEIVRTLTDGLSARGWDIQVIEIAPLSARLNATDFRSDSPESCEVDVLREIFTRPTATSAYGPVLAEEDVVGTKVRALAERGVARDALDVFAASRRWTTTDLEEFGRRHARDRFDLEALQTRLTAVAWIDDAEFEAYGTSPELIDELMSWAQEWADDLGRRLIRYQDFDA